MRSTLCLAFVCLLSGGLSTNVVSADTALVAVASNFMRPAQSLAQVFEADSGHRVELAFGSSGKLSSQIMNGAPFDVFLSADQAKVVVLIDKGLGAAGMQRTYALGALALWSAQPGLTPNIEWLRTQQQQRLAHANPILAPYGLAAQQVLANARINLGADRIVLGENISQVYQFVATGAVPAGFVALSQLVGEPPATGSQWRVPSSYHAPIKQDMLLLSRGEQNLAAAEFYQFLQSQSGHEIIRRFGYSLPQL